MTDSALPSVYPDDDSADWVKVRTWDGPTSVAGLLAALGVKDSPPAAKRGAVQHFMRLPAAASMPASLRRSLRQAGLL
jgi:hypothetical protein